jgi:hypothetical protein
MANRPRTKQSQSVPSTSCLSIDELFIDELFIDELFIDELFIVHRLVSSLLLQQVRESNRGRNQTAHSMDPDTVLYSLRSAFYDAKLREAPAIYHNLQFWGRLDCPWPPRPT